MFQRNSANRYIVLGGLILVLVLGFGVYSTRGGGGSGGKGSVAQAQTDTTPVVVAAQSIPNGTTFTYGQPLDNFFAVKQIPKDMVPLGAYTSVRAITNVLKGASCQPANQPSCQGQITATQTIYQGLPVVSGMFSTLGQYRKSAGPSFTIPYGYVAMSLEMSPANSVSGSINPGDTVDLIGSYTPTTSKGGVAAPAQTQYVLTNVKVVGVGSIQGPSNSSTGSTTSASGTTAQQTGSIVILTRYQDALVLQHLKDFGWQISAVLRSAHQTAIPHFRTVPVTDRWFFAKSSNPFRTDPGY